jgi:hypothetical protein
MGAVPGLNGEGLITNVEGPSQARDLSPSHASWGGWERAHLLQVTETSHGMPHLGHNCQRAWKSWLTTTLEVPVPDMRAMG